jgi:arginyl-tRNA synthetase
MTIKPSGPDSENILKVLNHETDTAVKQRLKQRREDKFVENKTRPTLEHDNLLVIKSNIVRTLAGNGYSLPESAFKPPPPKGPSSGAHLAFHVGQAQFDSEGERPALTETADAIVGVFQNFHGLKAEAIGPFVNITLDLPALGHNILHRVFEQKDAYGHNNSGNGQTVVIDYSSPNVAKNMTVAHLRSTVIGQSLQNIYEANGYVGFGVNHLGDWGTQFGKIMYQYNHYVAKEGDAFLQKLEQDPVAVLMEIYREFTAKEEKLDTAENLLKKFKKGDPDLVALWETFKAFGVSANLEDDFGKLAYQYNHYTKTEDDDFLQRLKDQPLEIIMEIYREFLAHETHTHELLDEARDLFLQLEQGDPKLLDLWKQFRDWSLQGFDPVYEQLGISFDAIQGESFYAERVGHSIEKAIAANVLTKRKGLHAVLHGQTLIDPATGKSDEALLKDEAGEWSDKTIRKPSGGSVYLARDIAAIDYRLNDLKADEILYVIGKEQRADMIFLMNIAAQMDWNKIGDSQHISFGHLNIDGKKMKSRAGEVVLLKDVLSESVAAAEILMKRQTSTDGDLDSDALKSAERIGLGAVIYNDLSRHRSKKDIDFDPDSASKLEAGSCAYLQYAYCRFQKVLQEYDLNVHKIVIPTELQPAESAILYTIAQFPEVVHEAMQTKLPNKIANYADELAKAMNAFYTQCHVGRAETEQQQFWLQLMKGSAQTLKNALALLHIQMPHSM